MKGLVGKKNYYKMKLCKKKYDVYEMALSIEYCFCKN